MIDYHPLVYEVLELLAQKSRERASIPADLSNALAVALGDGLALAHPVAFQPLRVWITPKGRAALVDHRLVADVSHGEFLLERAEDKTITNGRTFP